MREALYLLDDSRHLMSARVSRLAYRRRHGVRLKAVGCPFEIARRSVSIPTFETESLFRFAFRFPFRLHQTRAFHWPSPGPSEGARRSHWRARGFFRGIRGRAFSRSPRRPPQTPAHRPRALGTGVAASRHVARTPRARSSRASEHSDRLGAHAPGHRAFAEVDANARARDFRARRARGERARARPGPVARGARGSSSAPTRILTASALVARYAAADLANDAPDGNDPERRGGAARTGMLPPPRTISASPCPGGSSSPSAASPAS